MFISVLITARCIARRRLRHRRNVCIDLSLSVTVW